MRNEDNLLTMLVYVEAYIDAFDSGNKLDIEISTRLLRDELNKLKL